MVRNTHYKWAKIRIHGSFRRPGPGFTKSAAMSSKISKYNLAPLASKPLKVRVTLFIEKNHKRMPECQRFQTQPLNYRYLVNCNSKATTPMHFRNLQKISHRTGSLGLNLACEWLLLGMRAKGPTESPLMLPRGGE
jgi:hypothetical protein